MRVAVRIRTDRVHPIPLEPSESDIFGSETDGCEAIEFVGELVDVSHELADVIASANDDVE